MSEVSIVGSQLRALRVLLELSQESLASRCGLRRTDIAKVEGGANKASSWAMRTALASGLRLDADDLTKLLDGSISARQARNRMRSEAA